MTPSPAAPATNAPSRKMRRFRMPLPAAGSCSGILLMRFLPFFISLQRFHRRLCCVLDHFSARLPSGMIAASNFVPSSWASVRMAFVRLAPSRLAPRRSAPLNLAPNRSTPPRLASRRSAPVKSDLHHVGHAEVDAAQVHPAQILSVEPRRPQVRAVELGAREPRAAQIGAKQVGAREIRLIEPRPAELRAVAGSRPRDWRWRNRPRRPAHPSGRRSKDPPIWRRPG